MFKKTALFWNVGFPYWAVPHHHWNEETLAEVNCCCQRCLATGEVGKGKKEGGVLPLDWINKCQPLPGKVLWPGKEVFIWRKNWRKSRECFNKRKQGITSQFWLQTTFCQDILLFYLFCFSQKKYFERNEIFFVWNIVMTSKWTPPLPIFD